MPNRIVHFEIEAADQQRAKNFYSQAFGWDMQQMGEDMGNYVVVTTAEADAMPDGKRGAINGGFFAHDPKMPGQHPSVVVSVPDIQAAMKAVNKAGGEVLGEPMEIPGIGQYVAFYDTERNRVSMLQPKAQGSR